MNKLTTLVKYEDRGIYGDNKYRGNCSGILIKQLLEYFNPTKVTDFACGSDTTGDVCKDLKIKHDTRDLRIGFDLLNDEIDIRYDFNFYHPAYWDIIKYSGKVWGNKPNPSDLSQIKEYKDFIRALDYTVAKQFGALKTGGHMAILIGDIKKKGKLYSPFLDMFKPGSIQQIIIKEQINTFSERTNYNGKFIPIEHEYLVIVRKDNPYRYKMKITNDYEIDIRDSKKVTWKDVVSATLEKLGENSSLELIYREIEGHKKTESNNHWKEKVRQTLQLYRKVFINVDKGIWGLC